MKYTPSLHAIERAVHRLGVESNCATEWFNDIMRKAKYVITQGKSKAVYEHDGIRLVVDTDRRTIITVMPDVDTSVLKPVFEREYRRVKREVTRNIRKYELNIAELTVKMGERMTAKARARNPQTRDIIQRDIDVLQTMIDEHKAAITRENDRLENFERATGVYV